MTRFTENATRAFHVNDKFQELSMNAFSHISAISWRLVLVVEEAGVPGENQTSPLWSCKRWHIMYVVYI
jgi:hypothetical protein